MTSTLSYHHLANILVSVSIHVKQLIFIGVAFAIQEKPFTLEVQSQPTMTPPKRQAAATSGAASGSARKRKFKPTEQEEDETDEDIEMSVRH